MTGRIGPLTQRLYILRTSPVYLAVLLMRFSFAFTVVSLQYLVPIAVNRGVISAAYPIMEMLTGFAFGVLADKVGRKWITVVALFVSSFVSFSFTLTHVFLLLIVIHGVQGVCAGAIITSTLASLTDVAKRETRGREMGFYDFCTLGGYGLGFVFALVLINGNTSRDLLPFYAGSIVAMIAALFSLVFLKDQLVSFKRNFPLRENIRKIVRDQRTLALVATWFVLMILIGTALTYTRELFATIMNGSVHIPFLSSTSSQIPSRIGIFLVALALVGIFLLAVSQTTLGSLADRYGRERVVFLGQCSILGLMIVLVVLFGSNVSRIAVVPFVAVFGLGVLAFTPAGLAELADLAPESARGSTMGLYSMTVGAGTVFAPLAGGALITAYGDATGFAVLFSIGVVIMIFVLVSRLLAH